MSATPEASHLGALHLAREAAFAAGGLIRSNFGSEIKVDESTAHDIKIELDKRSQHLIEGILLPRFPHSAIYGEEGIHGDPDARHQWIIDPIDGTVNFFYGIPHFCVSIALREAGEIVAGVIYDPMRDEIWTACKNGPAMLNDRPIRVSNRTDLAEATVTVGFSKSAASIENGLPLFERMVRGAKKCRMMGSAALDVAYVACGRLDAYIEGQISLWDIAAGGLILERAGGLFQLTPLPDVPDKFSAVASNGKIPLGLE